MTGSPGHVSIGDVLTSLREEFPDVTISKIRFLESQGLIAPERTPSGYRKFYPRDIEQLRWILRQQKDHYLPLKVIRERLDALGGPGAFGADGTGEEPPAGVDVEPASRAGPGPAGAAVPAGVAVRDPDARRAAVDALFADLRGGGIDRGAAPAASDVGPSRAGTGASFTRAELAQAAGLEESDIVTLEEFGLLRPSAAGGDRTLFDEVALVVARSAAGFLRHGVEPRHLRMYRASAEREAALLAQLLLPYRRQRNPDARARATDMLAELSTLGGRLRAALLAEAVDRALDPPGR